MWTRLDDNAAFHPKVMNVGNEGFGALMRMTAWCGLYGTDGRVPEPTALAIAGSKQLLEQLLEHGFLENTLTGYAIHDFLQYNPSAAVVAAKRAARADAGRRGGNQRVTNRRKQRSKQLLEPTPSTESSNGSSNGVAKLNPDPDPDPSTEEAVSLSLDLPPRARDARGPLPFTVKAALEALKETAGTSITLAPFDAALAKPLTRLVRAFPDLADWRLAGEWLAAGGESWLVDGPDLRWLAKGGNLASAIGKARKWAELGRGPVDGRRARQALKLPTPPRAAVEGDGGWEKL